MGMVQGRYDATWMDAERAASCGFLTPSERRAMRQIDGVSISNGMGSGARIENSLKVWT